MAAISLPIAGCPNHQSPATSHKHAIVHRPSSNPATGKPLFEDTAMTDDSFVTYEAFGAIGDGVADDLAAICDAHAYANQHNLSVRAKPDATYHLGGRALTARIATDTDWNTSRFIIDDTQVED